MKLQNMGLELLPPSINNSNLKFKVVDEKTILFGLGAIKGVGEAAIDNMLYERGANGSFQDLFEFCRRIDTKKTNKRVIESLIKSGAIDEFLQSRSVLLATLEKAMQFSDQHASNDVTGQDDLFGLDITTNDEGLMNTTKQELPYVFAKEWDDHLRLQGEKDTLGFYLEGHPIYKI